MIQLLRDVGVLSQGEISSGDSLKRRSMAWRSSPSLISEEDDDEELFQSTGLPSTVTSDEEEEEKRLGEEGRVGERKSKETSVYAHSRRARCQGLSKGAPDGTKEKGHDYRRKVAFYSHVAVHYSAWRQGMIALYLDDITFSLFAITNLKCVCPLCCPRKKSRGLAAGSSASLESGPRNPYHE